MQEIFVASTPPIPGEDPEPTPVDPLPSTPVDPTIPNDFPLPGTQPNPEERARREGRTGPDDDHPTQNWKQ
jgi:hypothetical protein